MSIGWIIYWIDALSSLSVAFSILLVISFLFLMFVLGARIEHGESKELSILISVTLFLNVLFGSLIVFIPSKSTMYAILSASYAEKIVAGKQIPEKVIMVLDKKLNELLEPETKK